MYYPILKAKRHELNAASQLSKIIGPGKFRPVFEPINSNLTPLANTIETLAARAIVPVVVINPSQGDFASKSSVDVYSTLQKTSTSADRFLPCIKVKNANDNASLDLLTYHPKAAIYLESNIQGSALPYLINAPLVFANPQKNDPLILQNVQNLVLYFDSFEKKKRNADYDEISFYSNLHLSYKQTPNAVGFGDFTIMSEEYTGNGGPAYVVAIHVSYIEVKSNHSMYVRHFCSITDALVTANTPGKYMEALKKLIEFHNLNYGVFENSLGIKEFQNSYATSHFPGLGLVKEMSIKHHIETICNFID